MARLSMKTKSVSTFTASWGMPSQGLLSELSSHEQGPNDLFPEQTADDKYYRTSEKHSSDSASSPGLKICTL